MRSKNPGSRGLRLIFTVVQIITVFVVLNLSLEACKKNSTEVPAAVIALTKQTSCNCEPFIDQYKWKGKTTYVHSCKGPTCLCTVEYLDAQGIRIPMGTGYTFADFTNEASFQRNVWTCKE